MFRINTWTYSTQTRSHTAANIHIVLFWVMIQLSLVDYYQYYIPAYFKKHHTFSLFLMCYMLGISLCNLRMCFFTFDLWLLMYGQYGHCCWGILPHSSFICLIRLVLHTYALPQLVHEWLEPWGSTEADVSSRLVKSEFQPVSILVSSTSLIAPKQDDDGWYVDISVRNKKQNT